MKKKYLSALSVAGLSVALGGCLPTNQEANNITPTPQPTEEMMISQSPTPAQKIGQELKTETSYVSPAGEEKVAFSLTVDSTGTIVGANTVVMGKAPISIMRQESFAKEFPTILVGKSINDIEKVDRIGGSSLTTGAFNEALTTLKSQLVM